MKTIFLTLALIGIIGCGSTTPPPCPVVRTPTVGSIPATSTTETHQEEYKNQTYPTCPDDRRLEFLSHREIIQMCGSKCDFNSSETAMSSLAHYEYTTALCVPDHLELKGKP